MGSKEILVVELTSVVNTKAMFRALFQRKYENQ